MIVYVIESHVYYEGSAVEVILDYDPDMSDIEEEFGYMEYADGSGRFKRGIDRFTCTPMEVRTR